MYINLAVEKTPNTHIWGDSNCDDPKTLGGFALHFPMYFIREGMHSNTTMEQGLSIDAGLRVLEQHLVYSLLK